MNEFEKKLIISLIDYTPLRGESLQEAYFVVLGYDVDGRASETTTVDGDGFLGGVITPEVNELTRWYYGQVSPIFNIRKGSTHTFPGGLILHYGPLPSISSFYFAAMDSDRGSRDAGRVLNDVFSGTPNPSSFAGEVATLLGAGTPTVNVIREGFGILQRGIAALLLNNKDDIRYSNVFTLRESNNYFEGTHNVETDRAKMTFRVEIDEDDD